MKVYVVLATSPDYEERSVIGVAHDIDGAKLIAETMLDLRYMWRRDWEQIYNGCLRRVSSNLEYQEIQEWDLV